MSLDFTHTDQQNLISLHAATNPNSWLHINTAALTHNAAQYRKLIGPHTALALVVKSNAYGHGLTTLAPWMQQTDDINWLCTMNLSEAVTLREHGVTKPILVLGALDTNLDLAILYGIDVVLSDVQLARQLSALAVHYQQPAYVHVKVDTGMSRLGIAPDTLFSFLDELTLCPGIMVRGMYSHFARAVEPTHEQTRGQLKIFNTLVASLFKRHPYILYKHIASSGTAALLPDSVCNFVRIGKGIYGIWPSTENKKQTQQLHPWFDLRPALTWTTKPIAIKTIAANSLVSYGGTYRTTRPTTIAILPVGYFEGYPRALSNTGITHVNGLAAPVIGIVGMNMTIVDVTDIPDITIDSHVTLLGNQRGSRVEDMSEQAGTIPLEIVSRINPNLPRNII